MIYKNADEEGLPRHHFMKMFLAASPLVAASGGATQEFLPIYSDWIRHKLNREDFPRRLVTLESKGLAKRLGINTLKALPASVISAFLGGLILDKYLNRKLQKPEFYGV